MEPSFAFDNAVKYLNATNFITRSKAFNELTDIISKTRNRIWTTGMGKAALAANKLAATLSSNSVPAAFIHAGEALHGDFGAIRTHDILIAFSNSGQTTEVIQVAQKARQIDAYVALITGDDDNALVSISNCHMCFGKIEEACNLGLTPTTSIIIMMALADAITIKVQNHINITYKEYYRNHHSGYLGRVARGKIDESQG